MKAGTPTNSSAAKYGMRKEPAAVPIAQVREAPDVADTNAVPELGSHAVEQASRLCGAATSRAVVATDAGSLAVAEAAARVPSARGGTGRVFIFCCVGPPGVA